VNLPFEAPVEALREIARRYGTPAYAYDLRRVRAQAARLRDHLPPSVEVLYSLKANASLGLCGVLAGCGLGADVASPGELLTASAAGFPPERIFLTGPDKSPAVLAALAAAPGVTLSLDSVSELRLFAEQGRRYRAVLRLRPDFCSHAGCAAGPDSRFGLTADDLPRCREFLDAPGVEVIGFHVFAGSQVLPLEAIAHHFESGLDQALRAAGSLGVAPQVIDIGGGFGVPYAPEDRELDLAAVGQLFRSLVARAAPARLVVELGRYLVAQAGWYLTAVIGEQTHHGRRAVVVDGGTHQRGDLCGLGLRRRAFAPVPLAAEGPPAPTDVLGCLSLPGDVLIEAAALPPLARGDVLAFPNAGAYGLCASPCLFHGQSLPAEVAFDGPRLHLLRARRPPESVLDGQHLV
jgi:diaminopimelate decarboxylase